MKISYAPVISLLHIYPKYIRQFINLKEYTNLYIHSCTTDNSQNVETKSIDMMTGKRSYRIYSFEYYSTIKGQGANTEAVHRTCM